MGTACAVDNCGVEALGRCLTCGRAFCVTHQAHGFGGTPYTDLCAPCLNKRRVSEQEGRTAWRKSVEERINYLLDRLEADGVPMTPRALNVGFVEVYKGLRKRLEPSAGPSIESAWAIGEMEWRRRVDMTLSELTGITRSGRVVLMSGDDDPRSVNPASPDKMDNRADVLRLLEQFVRRTGITVDPSA